MFVSEWQITLLSLIIMLLSLFDCVENSKQSYNRITVNIGCVKMGVSMFWKFVFSKTARDFLMWQ